MNAAIAQHLNIAESAIIRVEEWANVIFCVAKKIGARFVSKKIVTSKSTEQKSISVEEFISTVKKSDYTLLRLSRWTKGQHDRVYFNTSKKSNCWVSVKNPLTFEDIKAAVSTDHYRKEIAEILEDLFGKVFTVAPKSPSLSTAKVLGVCWNCHVNDATHGGLCVDCVD